MKKILCMVVTMMMLLGQSSVVSAAEITPNDPYQTVLMSINEEYGLQLGYEPVDPNKVSLEEYEKTARSVAVSQKELEEFIANREEYVGKNIPILARASTKTVTKDCWGEHAGSLTMTATYNVNGTTISNPRDIHVNGKIPGIWYTIIGNPTTNILDSGRTLAVTCTGEYHALDMIFPGVKEYCEFYYDS